jgi:RNA polymerase sigma-70 factor (ECF subfamily)
MDFAEIARTIERSESACRQLAKRAREHVRFDTPPRNKVSADEAARFAKAFFEAAHQSDPTALQKLLAQDVALHADGGGKVNAVLNPIFGADNVARFYAGIAEKSGQDAMGASYEPLFINGLPGYVSREPDGVLQTVALDIRDGLVQAIYVIRNPDKLRHVAGRSLPDAMVR